MTTYSAVKRGRLPSSGAALQIFLALAGGLALFLFFALIVFLGYDLRYAGKVYPGVSVAGVNLAGMKPEQAAAQLAEQVAYPQTGKIVFKDGEQVWIAYPAELGLTLDAQASAQAAYLWGRSGNPLARLSRQISAWHSGEDLPSVLVYDERLAQQYVDKIAAQVNRDTIEASLSVNGLDVVVLPGQVGRMVDTQATLASLELPLRSLTDGLVTVVVEESPPAILDATQQAEIARRVLSSPLVLQIPDAQEGDPGPWLIPAEQLAEMLTIQRVQTPQGASYQVGLGEEALQSYVSALAADINRYASNARFIFNDETHLLEIIQPAVVGRILDVEATVKAINERVVEGEHTLPLVLHYNEPQIGDDATGEQLGITELVTAYTSYFRGSTTERMQNIEIAAANFHGLLVPPGAIFSMADVMGSVSLDTGYAEAWIIFGGRTIKGVGGGVCQVSTTLFRTAFFAGFPIIERYPHAYRVSYYEQTRTGHNPNLAGLDATVFVPMVDFKFQNDTPYWLLMETYFNATSRSLTWKFYSTSDGRTVEWESTGPMNVVEPPDPLYEENPDLSKGVIKQVDWAAEGADVEVVRKVYRDGQLLYDDKFTTHYLPWRDVFQYGPGTELPSDRKPRWPINPSVWLGDPLAATLPVALVLRKRRKVRPNTGGEAARSMKR